MVNLHYQNNDCVRKSKLCFKSIKDISSCDSINIPFHYATAKYHYFQKICFTAMKINLFSANDHVHSPLLM